MYVDVSLGKIDSMRAAGELVNKALDIIGKNIEIDITFDELDHLCEEVIRSNNGIPGLIGFNG